MYELEVGTRKIPSEALPAAMLSDLLRTVADVEAVGIAPWEEHCTECAMPACYRTCDLYEARPDGKCRRFVNGIEIFPLDAHPQRYLAKIRFKRWGQLQARTSINVLPLTRAARLEGTSRALEELAAGAPFTALSIAGRKGIPARLVRRWKQRLREEVGRESEQRANVLRVEVINPEARRVRLSISVSRGDGANAPPFQSVLELGQGLTVGVIPVDQIAKRIGDLTGELVVTLNPNLVEASDEGLSLYFGLCGFVRQAEVHDSSVAGAASAVGPSKTKYVKIAVWDLDNTLWDGTILEDGPAGVRLRRGVAEVIRQLDARGIVNSILSKNHMEEAMQVLRGAQLDELFVYPSIEWSEKGTRMKRLVHDFNVDPGTFAFIDDQAFERGEVERAVPGVRSYDVTEIEGLLELPEFNPPLSAESAGRRRFYQSEERRSRDVEEFPGDYSDFLRTCNLRATIIPSRHASFDRIQELVQRTNQLNYSGTHYTRDEVARLLSDTRYESFVVSCTDNYGDYGSVGFVLIDREKPELTEAMFSCRIQFKRVEHAVLCFLMNRYKTAGATGFFARFVETTKNQAAASVFSDLGFTLESQVARERSYMFDLSGSIPNEGIVQIDFEGEL